MNDMSDTFKGQTVLLTGAAGGIGRATARVLHDRGATVLLTDIAEPQLQQASAEFDGADRIAARAADLTSAAEIEALFAWAETKFGSVDHLVNNAGIVTSAPFESFPDQDWERVIAINLTAAYRCTKAYASRRIARHAGAGAIVNIASMSYKGMTQQVAYVASKGGIVSMTKASAMEFARHGIRANAVAPGMTETAMIAVESDEPDVLRKKMIPLIPLRRYAQPREMATAIAFLLSSDASYITGEVLHVAGGARL